MLNLDGIAAISRLVRASPATRILILSMPDEAEYAQAATRHGACGLVCKAASAKRLVSAIQAASRGEYLPIRQQLSPCERETLASVAEGWTRT